MYGYTCYLYKIFKTNPILKRLLFQDSILLPYLAIIRYIQPWAYIKIIQISKKYISKKLFVNLCYEQSCTHLCCIVYILPLYETKIFG